MYSYTNKTYLFSMYIFDIMYKIHDKKVSKSQYLCQYNILTNKTRTQWLVGHQNIPKWIPGGGRDMFLQLYSLLLYFTTYQSALEKRKEDWAQFYKRFLNTINDFLLSTLPLLRNFIYKKWSSCFAKYQLGNTISLMIIPSD